MNNNAILSDLMTLKKVCRLPRQKMKSNKAEFRIWLGDLWQRVGERKLNVQLLNSLQVLWFFWVNAFIEHSMNISNFISQITDGIILINIIPVYKRAKYTF